ncbi:MAG TPA: phage tail protein [Paraburkholderia sp.]|jgi:hypothetical protein
MTPDWANDVQENIARAIEGAGITLAKGDGDQLLEAIKLLAQGAGMPIGAVVPFVGSQTAIPSNCVPLMGQTVARTAYPALTAFVLAGGVIVDDGTWLAQPLHRTKFSTGDGATTIRLPDLRGESIYGSDLGRGIRGGAIGDWLDGDIKPHIHQASTDLKGSHSHAGTTDMQGGVVQGTTGAGGAHNPAPDGFTRLLKPPYTGSYTGDADSSGSGQEQAIGPGDSADIIPAPDHTHTVPAIPPHLHNFSTDVAPDHDHVVTVESAGGTETRQRGTNYPFIMRVL